MAEYDEVLHEPMWEQPKALSPMELAAFCTNKEFRKILRPSPLDKMRVWAGYKVERLSDFMYGVRLAYQGKHESLVLSGAWWAAKFVAVLVALYVIAVVTILWSVQP